MQWQHTPITVGVGMYAFETPNTQTEPVTRKGIPHSTGSQPG